MWKNLKTQLAHRRSSSRSSPGQGLAEYALMLALVALAVIIIVNLLEVSIADVFSRLVQQAPVAPPSLANYTPPPTYTPVPTLDPNATNTPTPSLTPTLTPSNTPPPTETPTLTPSVTNTPVCPGYGPYGLPGRVEMENFRCGGPDLAFVDSGNLDGGPGSGIYRQDVTTLGPDLAVSTDGSGYQLGWLVSNEWTQYLVNAPESRFYDFSVRVASGGTNGRFRLQIIRNGAAFHTTDPISVPNTGGASSWSNVVVESVPMLAGASEVRFIVDNGGFNVNYFDVSFGAVATPTATPGVPCYTLAVSLNPAFGGNVSRNPLPNCGGDRYTQGTNVTLSASPNANYGFNNWSGDATGTNSNVTITMSSNRSVAANFVQCFTVTTAVNPANSGAVNLSPAPNCGSQYRAGTNVTFSASANIGHAFNNWSGSLSGNANPTSLTINAAANVTANYDSTPSGVLYVVSNHTNPTGSEIAIRDRLQGMGFIVTMLNHSNANSYNPSGMALIIVSPSVNTNTYGTAFRDSPIPLMLMRRQLAGNLRLGSANSSNNTQTQIDMIAANSGHPLAAGKSGRVTVSNTLTMGSARSVGSGAVRIANITSASDRFVIVGYPTGATMTSGTAPAARVGFFLEDATRYTSNGWDLFDAAVIWAINN